MTEPHSIQPAQNRNCLHPYSAHHARKYNPKISNFTVGEWQDILEQANGACFYCASQVGSENLVVEHQIPLSRGGDNSVSNIVASCVSCNSQKGTRTAEEFAVYKATRSAIFKCKEPELHDPKHSKRVGEDTFYCLACRRAEVERRQASNVATPDKYSTAVKREALTRVESLRNRINKLD